MTERTTPEIIKTIPESLVARVTPCFSSMWNKTEKCLPNINTSCLVLRQNTKLCNMYYDGKKWMDDGYDSKQERVFEDVTHWILLSDVPLPK
jgi:hypothetical protein